MNNIAFVWAGLIVVFTLIEAFTLGLTSIWFAVGSLAALIAYAIGFNWPVQLVVFIGVAIIMLVYTRPIVKNVFKVGQNKTNIDALIGQSGYVTKALDSKNYGLVKVNGQIWTAKSADNDSIALDEEVLILAIEGVKIIVKKKNQ